MFLYRNFSFTKLVFLNNSLYPVTLSPNKNTILCILMKKRRFILWQKEKLSSALMNAWHVDPRRLPALEFDRVVTENLHGFSMRVLPGECVALLDRSNTILEDIVGLMSGGLRPPPSFRSKRI